MQESSVIVPDGQIYSGQRDPPGQLTSYIPPGDTRKENYRAVTFKEFPQTTPVSPTGLAGNGFFYTGYKDRVQCFSCANKVENWVMGDNAREKRWHKNDCGFINGTDTSNEPLLSIYRRYLASNSHSHRKNTSLNHPPNFTQSPSGATNNIHSYNTLRNVPNTDLTPQESQEFLEIEYPCLHPVNPHMRSLATRIGTFESSGSRRWPRERLRAGVNEIAEAGFFSLGERDRVKCFYCNGGLQNWDYDDEPWTEHAKWFPSCEFVRRMKGSSFVENITARFPNINRPTPTVRQVPRQSSNLPPSRAQDIPPVPALSTEEIVENALRNDISVIQAKEMGYSVESLRAVLKRKQEATGQLFESPNDLLDALTEYQATQEVPRAPVTRVNLQPPESMDTGNLEEASNANSMLSELQSIEQARNCKVCRNRPSDVVLLPCGHLSVCSNCSENLLRCPVCHKQITDKIKAFRS